MHLPVLLHGKERCVWGDSAYQGQTEVIHQHAPFARDMTHRRYRYAGKTEESLIADPQLSAGSLIHRDPGPCQVQITLNLGRGRHELAPREYEPGTDQPPPVLNCADYLRARPASWASSIKELGRVEMPPPSCIE